MQILTLEPWKDNTILLRLEHIFQKDEDTELSQPVTVDLEVRNVFFDSIVCCIYEQELIILDSIGILGFNIAARN